MAEANRYQKRLLESYPNIDLLPLDPTDEAEVARAVAERRTGDGLFEFLWHEFADLGDEETPEVDKALGRTWTSRRSDGTSSMATRRLPPADPRPRGDRDVLPNEKQVYIRFPGRTIATSWNTLVAHAAPPSPKA